MSIANRFALILALSLLSLLGVGGYSLLGLSAAQDRFENVQVNMMPSIKVLTDTSLAVQQVRIAVRDHLLAETPVEKEANEKKIADQGQTIEKDLARYEKELLFDDTDGKMVQKDKQSWANYLAVVQKLLAKSRANDVEGVRAELSPTGDFSVTAKQLTQDLADHMDYNWKLANDLRTSNNADYRREKWVQISIIMLTLLIVGALGYRLAIEIRSRLNRLSAFMNDVNQTLDFTGRIRVTRFDELGITGDAFNKLMDKLQQNLKSISTSVQAVTDSASQMATTSNQVAAASHQQSEAASSMAATVEQMTVSINHVADQAHETNQLTSKSGELSSSGEHVIDQVTDEIQNIATTVDAAAEMIRSLEQHSQQIANVVQVIKDVADQTNLLALNAAIEAARAGEQGRGFAVVADEVRKLAERTALSTQEIATTVETMRVSSGNAVASMEKVVGKVSEGVKRAETANATIKQIGATSRETVGMVSEIAEAIREQGSATNNIAMQVERIAQMSDENSSAAANSAQSAQELDRLANEMQAIVSTYRLDSSVSTVR